jgi:hypothetical protein
MSEEPVSPSTSESATDVTEPHEKKRKSTYYVRKVLHPMLAVAYGSS